MESGKSPPPFMVLALLASLIWGTVGASAQPNRWAVAARQAQERAAFAAAQRQAAQWRLAVVRSRDRAAQGEPARSSRRKARSKGHVGTEAPAATNAKAAGPDAARSGLPNVIMGLHGEEPALPTGPDGHDTRVKRDVLGRVYSTVGTDGSVRRWTYLGGRLSSYTAPGGASWTVIRDGATGFPVILILPDGSRVERRYNRRGRLLEERIRKPRRSRS